MNTIILVSTTHKEKGLANLDNLYSVLQYINPEIVFTELPYDEYSDYFTNFTKRTLESDTINTFRKNKQIEIVPVDMSSPDITVLNEINCLFDAIHNKSKSIDSILEHIEIYTRQYGFPYINSEKHYEHLTSQKEEEQKTIQNMNNKMFTDLYKKWINLNSLREDEMLSNIQNYFIKNPF
ncbi:MAG: hypothetical protein P8045_12285, partial [Candidatus Thiodiazotropha sp.]